MKKCISMAVILAFLVACSNERNLSENIQKAMVDYKVCMTKTDNDADCEAAKNAIETRQLEAKKAGFDEFDFASANLLGALSIPEGYRPSVQLALEVNKILFQPQIIIAVGAAEKRLGEFESQSAKYIAQYGKEKYDSERKQLKWSIDFASIGMEYPQDAWKQHPDLTAKVCVETNSNARLSNICKSLNDGSTRCDNLNHCLGLGS
jgi:hypothetical protein